LKYNGLDMNKEVQAKVDQVFLFKTVVGFSFRNMESIFANRWPEAVHFKYVAL